MEIVQKKLTILKKIPSEPHSAIKSANYFDDLTVIAVTRRVFSRQTHRLTPCGKDAFSLELITRGVVKLHLDRMSVTLQAPVVFWIGDRFRNFRFEYLDDGTPYEHCWIDFSGVRGRRIYDALCAFSDNCAVSLTAGNSVEELFGELLNKFHMDKEIYHSDIVLGIEKIVHQLYWYGALRTPQAVDDPHRILEAAELFRKNPLESFDIAALAANRELSLMHFRALFKEKLGAPVGEYLTMLRMQNAATMLEANRMRISEIAEICGFGALSSFSRTFRRYYQISPRRYQNKIQETGGAADLPSTLLPAPGENANI